MNAATTSTSFKGIIYAVIAVIVLGRRGLCAALAPTSGERRG